MYTFYVYTCVYTCLTGSTAASLKLQEVVSREELLGTVQDDSGKTTEKPAANGVVEARERKGREGGRGEGEKKEVMKEQWRQSLPEQDMKIEELETSPKARRPLCSESESIPDLRVVYSTPKLLSDHHTIIATCMKCAV